MTQLIQLIRRVIGRACVCSGIVLMSGLVSHAQVESSLAGKVTRAGSGDAMGGAAVVIEELRREVRTAADGTYRFDGLTAGEYHVSVRAEGYSSRRAEITVGPGPATLDLEVDLDLHFAEVLSVSPNPRSQFESFQPTSVLSGDELTRDLQDTIGGTLQSQPGVTMRALGPGPARPVIRGLDGDRVLVLQDTQRLGDLSSQSGDHGVPINPASAQRIEVVRGPATLLYGANAIGGLVNIVTDQIPTERVTKPTGSLTFNLGNNANPAGAAGDVHVGKGRLAMHFGGGGQRSGVYHTPAGAIDNSQSQSGFVNVGGAWTGDRRYAGISYGYDDTKYGVPVLEEGAISLTPKRHAFTARAGGQGLDGGLSSYRATLGVRRYTHSELEGDQVGTQFRNNTIEGELLLSHKPIGRLSGTAGGWFLSREFSAEGAEALSPPVDQWTTAGFLYEEVTWPHFTWQFGGRVDRTSFEPQASVLPNREFTEFSGSVGALFRPKAANDSLVVALSFARAARNPALEELYFFGPHAGNLTFEIGNPNLNPERALGFDMSLRARSTRVRGEVTLFRNAIKDFVFRTPLSDEEFEAREAEFDDRFGVVADAGGAGDTEEASFPFVEFAGTDATLWGLEAHADLTLTEQINAEFTWDLVRGERTIDNLPLPRIPPQRFMAGLRYTTRALQFGVNASTIARQGRVFTGETETAGYGLLRLYATYTLQSDRMIHTLTARLDNATNELYRNHLNFLKDVVPEMGRAFRLVYAAKF